ncbi:hypothetical protein ACP4OV_002437 [Aristida adscensionis]
MPRITPHKRRSATERISSGGSGNQQRQCSSPSQQLQVLRSPPTAAAAAARTTDICASTTTPRIFSMHGAELAAGAAAVGTMLMLQGCAMPYMKLEFSLQSLPASQRSMYATVFLNCITVAVFSRILVDRYGRWRMLLCSVASFLITLVLTPLVMNVHMNIFMRFIGGCGFGSAVSIGPSYVSELAPAGGRGWLNTLPHLDALGLVILSCYTTICTSLMQDAGWRIMLTVPQVPSLITILLIFLYLPQSPKWLVSQGRLDEARQALQRLRATEDVDEELDLLIESMGGGQIPYVEEEEWPVDPIETTIDELVLAEGFTKLYRLEEDFCFVAFPVME